MRPTAGSMGPRRAGRQNWREGQGLMPGPDAIVLAPGHYAERSAICKKRAALDKLSIGRVLGRMTDAKTLAGVLNRPPDKEFFGGIDTHRTYLKAMACKDWITSDSIVLDTLAPDGTAYRKLIESEEWSRAFNGWMYNAASSAPFAYRWMDPEELESLKSGTFHSKVVKGIKRRDHKALSLNPRLDFFGRKVVLTVPLTSSILGSVRHVCYTALPRVITEEDEEIGDPKNVLHADEAEIRVPDGTPIPPGATVSIRRGAGIGRGALAGIEKWCTITN